MTTREQYIQNVRDCALTVAVLEPSEREALSRYKMVYGTGHGSGARGITFHAAWQHGTGDSEPLIEICAFAEESLVQLAGTTIHEMAHALAGVGKGHGKDWITCCKRLGLRGMKAAGTTYRSAMFVPRLREMLAALPVPDDGRVIGWNAGIGSGLTVPVRPCSAGIGSRGGKSRGIGSGSRLRKFVCGCEPPVILRAGRDVLAVTCDLCLSQFRKV